jgi:5'-methylthioadenosine phosphorylase
VPAGRSNPPPLRIGIIGGSGLGEGLRGALGADLAERGFDTPFGPPAAPLLVGEVEGVPVALLQRHGHGHRFNPTAVPHRANVYALKLAGCTHVVASGATGSLREDIHPGEVVLCDQLIDRTVARPRSFFDGAAVHVEFAEPFCPVMRGWLEAAGATLPGVRLHGRGTYVCMEGPSFSTRAESALHRQMGGDVVGMTALPEARLAREAEMAYALLALPTDYDCWRPRDGAAADGASLLREIMGNLERAASACLALVRAALRDVAPLRRRPSPAHDALRLAIWSDRSAIEPAQVKRLAALWGRYFPGA